MSHHGDIGYVCLSYLGDATMMEECMTFFFLFLLPNVSLPASWLKLNKSQEMTANTFNFTVTEDDSETAPNNSG